MSSQVELEQEEQEELHYCKLFNTIILKALFPILEQSISEVLESIDYRFIDW